MPHGMTNYQPATRWEDASPTGNGIVGALVYGGLAQEQVVLNHDDLWFRSEPQAVPDISGHLPALRALLARGRWREAGSFLADQLSEAGYSHRVDPCHPACALKVVSETVAPFSDYRREVDFASGEVCVRWREAEVERRRQLFVSRADDVVVLRLSSQDGAPLNYHITLVPHDREADIGWGSGKGRVITPVPADFRHEWTGVWSHVVGRYHLDGGEFGGLAKVVARGGACRVGEYGLEIAGAHEVLVLIKLFANEPAAAALPRLEAELDALPADYATLFERHARLHRELFLRARLELLCGPEAEYGNERLLLDAYDGDVPAALIQRLFDYGRFLLICSSAPGGLPANLQGLWNGDYAPAWAADFHNDINVQMNYWAALPGNLPEAAVPYFDYYDRCLNDFRENARAIYGCGGILAPISQSTSGKIHPGCWVNWTAGAGWLAQLYYDYWEYTGDDDFLRERAVPFLREVALFYEDFLFEGADGRLVFAPSLSPENTPGLPDASIVTVNATMDAAVAREVLTRLCAACERLDIEAEGRCRWEALLDRLPDYQVNEEGALREWLWPELPDNYPHRHLSHLYALFPGNDITVESEPALFEACRIAVEKRLTLGKRAHCGWSYAQMACLHARLGAGEEALECLELLARSCVGPNLFTYLCDWRGQGLAAFWGEDKSPPFQIDANFGFTAAVLEMLIFSRPGLIKLLPALPANWSVGRVTGVLCRGGVTVSVEWDMPAGRMVVDLLSPMEQEITIKFPHSPLRIESGAPVRESPLGADYRVVLLRAAETCRLEAYLG
jgi:alpha-L-fucosidase 2